MASELATARQVEVCNGSPVETFMAAGADMGAGFRTRGWYPLSPGGCTSFGNIVTAEFYYYAESYSELGQWLTGSRLLAWRGSQGLCVDPNNAFDQPLAAQCSNKRYFNKVVLNDAFTRVTLYEKLHMGMPLHEAPELHRVLMGRMQHEQRLHASPGREPPFQLGLTLAGGPGAARVTGIRPGMPAEDVGLQPGDEIVALNGYRITSAGDLLWVLDSVDLFRSEPLPLSIVRGGRHIDGEITPLFYPFNHQEYRPGGEIGAFLGAVFDNATFGLGNSLLCASLLGLGEGLTALADDRSFDGQKFAGDTRECSSSLDLKVAKNGILYRDAAVAGAWASLVVPGPGIFKLGRAARAVPLAARSRLVARTGSSFRF